MSNKKVLATVDGREITEEHIDRLLAGLGPQRVEQFNTPQGRRTLLNEVITQELIYLDAKDNNLDQDPGYLTELES